MVKFGIHAVQSIIALVVIGCSAARVSEHTSNGYALAIFTVSLAAHCSPGAIPAYFTKHDV